MRNRSDSHVIPAPLDLEGREAFVDLNVDGLGKHSAIKCAVLDEQHRPQPGYASEECTGPTAKI